MAVLGATGLVGRRVIEKLESGPLAVAELRLWASERSAGVRIPFRGEQVPVEPVDRADFRSCDIIFSAVDTGLARELVPKAARAGAVVVDKSSAFRLDPDVPLVVPEVNPHAVERHRGIIASPNCSTVQLVVALKPLHDIAGLRRVIVATYQSVSGSGKGPLEGLPEEARRHLAGEDPGAMAYPALGRPIAFNVLPHCDGFDPDGYTREETKLLHETRRILELPDLAVTATAVRVPVPVSHSEAVLAEFERPLTPEEARAALAAAPGVELMDDPAAGVYPTPREAEGRDEVFVGRIRQEHGNTRALWLWIVSDNLLKGAATNAVQIAQLLHQRRLVGAVR